MRGRRSALSLAAAVALALPSAGAFASSLSFTVTPIGEAKAAALDASAAVAAPSANAAVAAPGANAAVAAPGANAVVAAPSAPTSLAGQSVQPDTAVFLWRDNSSDESAFVVEARAADNPTFGPVGDPLPPNTTAVTVTGLSAGITYVFRVRAVNASGDSAPSNSVTVTALSSSDCQPGATAMCLHNNEFRVQALFLAGNGQSGEAQTVKLVADSGYLWFFASSNIEAVVKVLDGCLSNSHFWVFAGGLTNVRVLLTVTDTVAEISRSYNNPLGKAFQPIQDTSAFATCPE